MEQTTLTICLLRDLVQEAERYAEQHQTSLTQLIGLYLRHLATQEHLLDNAPIVRNLSGILPIDAAKDGYNAYLEEKHGRSTATQADR
jgi:hypothetical protein